MKKVVTVLMAAGVWAVGEAGVDWKVLREGAGGAVRVEAQTLDAQGRPAVVDAVLELKLTGAAEFAGGDRGKAADGARTLRVEAKGGKASIALRETAKGAWRLGFASGGRRLGECRQGGAVEVAVERTDGGRETHRFEFSGERFALPRGFFEGRGVKSFDLIPDFAQAKQGDEGYFLMPDGLMGTFREKEGRFAPYIRNYHPVWMMRTPEVNFMAQAVGMAYSYETHAEAKAGKYRIFNRYKTDGRVPYEDVAVDFKFRPARATWCDMAREYRERQLTRGGCRPIAERAKTRPELAYAATNVEVRVRMGWKPVPAKVRDQTPFTEPPLKVAVTFDRCREIMQEFKRQGIGGAEFCLVGWNKGGHDGAYPQIFPVEPAMGGEAKLRALLKDAKEMGFQTVAHNNYSDAYLIADCFDEEYVLKRADGSLAPGGTWGGGFQYLTCPQRMCERFLVKDLEMMKDLGFRGLHYIDVISSQPLRKCWDPRHPMNERDCIKWYSRIQEESQKRMGGFASEGIFDYCADTLDYCLYGYFYRLIPGEIPKFMDRHVPLAQVIYNGIVLINPFCGTVNYTIKDNVKRLKLVEFGGRPVFYFYTNFVEGFRWMGDEDLTCGTDAELAESVKAIRRGHEEFRKLADLQYAFMDGHELLAPEVSATRYSQGTVVVVNHGKADFEYRGEKVPAGDWRRFDGAAEPR